MTNVRYVAVGDTLEVQEGNPYALAGMTAVVQPENHASGIHIVLNDVHFPLKMITDNEGGLMYFKKIATNENQPFLAITCAFSDDLTGQGYTYKMPANWPAPVQGMRIKVPVGNKGKRRLVYYVAMGGDMSGPYEYKWAIEVLPPETAEERAEREAAAPAPKAKKAAPSNAGLKATGDDANTGYSSFDDDPDGKF